MYKLIILLKVNDYFNIIKLNDCVFCCRPFLHPPLSLTIISHFDALSFCFLLTIRFSHLHTAVSTTSAQHAGARFSGNSLLYPLRFLQ